jgi:hypothetical protein
MSAAAPGQRDALLATKLAVPRARMHAARQLRTTVYRQARLTVAASGTARLRSGRSARAARSRSDIPPQTP